MPVADSHDFIQVRGARENNLGGVSLDIPKRRLTVFTGVSGSGKSSLVFDTIAAESQRLINETYTAFVQNFMPSLGRPDVDSLQNLSAAIIVDQERIGANARSTVGTATDAHTMLRVLFSRAGTPYVGPPSAFSFNRAEGMCPECEGLGRTTEFDLDELVDRNKSLNQGAIKAPGYAIDSWYWQLMAGSGLFDPDLPLKDYPAESWRQFLYQEPMKIKVGKSNLTFEGLVTKIKRQYLGKDPQSMQSHARAFAERAIRQTTCPACHGVRLNEAARTTTVDGRTIGECSAMQISDLAEFVAGIKHPGVGPMLDGLRQTLESFVTIGLGYLSLDRESSTLSGGEAQRVKLVRHLGSSLSDVTYVFDEPTVGLHPHDIQQMNDLLLQLRDKGNTVLVVEHKPETIRIADHVVDLGPGAGLAGGRLCYAGDLDGLNKSGTLTGRYLDHRVSLRDDVRRPTGKLVDRERDPAQPAERQRGRPARRPHGGHRGRRIREELTDPRIAGRPGRRDHRRAGADPRVEAQQSGDLHRAARSDPGRVREGEQGEAGAVQRELGRRLPDLQGHRSGLHGSGDDGRGRLDLRGLQRRPVHRGGARLPVAREEHQRGTADDRDGGAGVLHQGSGAGDPGSAVDGRPRIHRPRPATDHAVRR